MKDYRAFIIDSDGNIQQRIDLRCENDEAAKQQAELFFYERDVELWQRDRMICKFKAK